MRVGVMVLEDPELDLITDTYKANNPGTSPGDSGSLQDQ